MMVDGAGERADSPSPYRTLSGEAAVWAAMGNFVAWDRAEGKALCEADGHCRAAAQGCCTAHRQGCYTGLLHCTEAWAATQGCCTAPRLGCCRQLSHTAGLLLHEARAAAKGYFAQQG